MTIETWLAFAAASAVLLVIPGPTILLVISYALGRGMRTALPVAVGVALGDFTAMTLSMLGVGALLAASSLLFTALKWAGAAYLIWLGLKKIFGRAEQVDGDGNLARHSHVRLFRDGFIVNLLNPKTALFFLAFLPQFVEPERGSLVSQIIFLGMLFALLGFISSVTKAFCHDCNRLRLDSNGNIYGCLSSNHPIALDNQEDEATLISKLQQAMDQKQSLKFVGSDLSMLHIGG